MQRKIMTHFVILHSNYIETHLSASVSGIAPRHSAVKMILPLVIRSRARITRRSGVRGIEARQSQAAIGVSPRTRLPARRSRLLLRIGAVIVLRDGIRRQWRGVRSTRVVAVARHVGIAVLSVGTDVILARSAAGVGRIAPAASAVMMIDPRVQGGAAGGTGLVAALGEGAAVGVGAAVLPAGRFGVELGGAAEFVGEGRGETEEAEEERCEDGHGGWWC